MLEYAREDHSPFPTPTKSGVTLNSSGSGSVLHLCPSVAKPAFSLAGAVSLFWLDHLRISRDFSLPLESLAMTKKNIAAFTLIELLIVITIIAVLASIALPAYNGVQERANQTKDLSNAKQIALALRQFAIDNNGSYPAKAPSADYATATALAATDDSNKAFWWLFPNYLQSEDIFVISGSKFTPGNPDNKIDPANAGGQNFTLAAGENNYAYVLGLTDTSNPAFPLLADGFSTLGPPPAYDTSKSNKGGVWAAKKAIVAFCDSSAQIMKVDTTKKTVVRSATGKSLFEPDTDWLDANSNPVLNPK
jgi:prepilin-type N-terminal cleavage/methylation domain-containing protein